MKPQQILKEEYIKGLQFPRVLRRVNHEHSLPRLKVETARNTKIQSTRPIAEQSLLAFQFPRILNSMSSQQLSKKSSLSVSSSSYLLLSEAQYKIKTTIDILNRLTKGDFTHTRSFNEIQSLDQSHKHLTLVRLGNCSLLSKISNGLFYWEVLQDEISIMKTLPRPLDSMPLLDFSLSIDTITQIILYRITESGQLALGRFNINLNDFQDSKQLFNQDGKIISKKIVEKVLVELSENEKKQHIGHVICSMIQVKSNNLKIVQTLSPQQQLQTAKEEPKEPIQVSGDSMFSGINALTEQYFQTTRSLNYFNAINQKIESNSMLIVVNLEYCDFFKKYDKITPNTKVIWEGIANQRTIFRSNTTLEFQFQFDTLLAKADPVLVNLWKVNSSDKEEFLGQLTISYTDFENMKTILVRQRRVLGQKIIEKPMFGKKSGSQYIGNITCNLVALCQPGSVNQKKHITNSSSIEGNQ